MFVLHLDFVSSCVHLSKFWTHILNIITSLLLSALHFLSCVVCTLLSLAGIDDTRVIEGLCHMPTVGEPVNTHESGMVLGVCLREIDDVRRSEQRHHQWRPPEVRVEEAFSLDAISGLDWGSQMWKLLPDVAFAVDTSAKTSSTDTT